MQFRTGTLHFRKAPKVKGRGRRRLPPGEPFKGLRLPAERRRFLSETVNAAVRLLD